MEGTSGNGGGVAGCGDSRGGDVEEEGIFFTRSLSDGVNIGAGYTMEEKLSSSMDFRSSLGQIR